MKPVDTPKELRERLLSWVEERRCPGEPYGRFKFAVSSPRPSLSASLIALLDIYDYFDLLSNITEEEKSTWASYIQSFQDPDTGLFVDRHHRRGIGHVDWQTVEEYDTARALDGLKLLESKPCYPIAKSPGDDLGERLHSSEKMLDWIDSLDWKAHPWGAATAVQQVMAILQEESDNLSEAQRAVKAYFLHTQDTSTGLWGETYEKPDELASAAYKVLIIFGEFGWTVPKRKMLAAWAYDHFLNGDVPRHMCALRNRICLLLETWVDRSGSPRRMTGPRTFTTGIMEALSAERLDMGAGEAEAVKRSKECLMQRLVPFYARDGGYAFYRYGRATSHHNSVILCKGGRHGDFLAASNAAFCHACLTIMNHIQQVQR